MSARASTVALTIAAALVGAAACARSLQELAPFPCADDGTCPAPFACVADECRTLAQAEGVDPFPCTNGACPTFVDESGATVAPYACIADQCRTEAQARAVTPFACFADNTCPGFAGAPSPFGCFASLGCVARNECDAKAQSGCDDSGDDGARGKCTVLTDVFGTTSQVCVVEDDLPLSEGATCQREDDVFGLDNCGAGSFCSGLGSPGEDPDCRAFCDDNGDCAVADGSCVTLGVDQVDVGVCANTCPFLDGGCGGDGSCKIPAIDASGASIAVCGADGALTHEEQCAFSEECEENHLCAGSCFALCDVVHPCESGADCHNGVCECRVTESQYCPASLGAAVCVPFGGDQNGYFNNCAPTGGVGLGGGCSANEECASGFCFTEDLATQPFLCRQPCDVEHGCPAGGCPLRPNGDVGVCPL